MSKQPALAIAILNLMPTKEATARHLTELLSVDSQRAVVTTLLYPASHYIDKAVPDDLQRNYQTFAEVSEQHFDGFIITGAPLEQLAFEDIDYWQELCRILDHLKVTNTPLLAICWGAQAALYHYYGIEKESLPAKKVGVFTHEVHLPDHPLATKLGGRFNAPHSRYTAVKANQVTQAGLLNLASSSDAGLYLLASQDERESYVFGHAEYDTFTLASEYQRDLETKSAAPFPKNYFPQNDPQAVPLNTWADHGEQLFRNWVELVSLTEKNVLSINN